MPNGSLSDHLKLVDGFNNWEPLSWKKRLEICIGATKGLHYLHRGAKRSIFHRHVKPANIILDKNWVPKLTDFGLSLQGPNSMSKPKPIVVERIQGTHGFMAPEYCMNFVFTDKCDFYSFGVVLLIVLCGEDFDSIFWKINDLDKSKNSSLPSEGSTWKNLA
ncbi:hypothetical protein L6164_006666 [Bauhinia variegata]|uniref:Uncharacterized protein n=1 Tax=Bauhinia variegata TaxID=167791 RepID=A0ACB9PVP2_BAUVA|nr:hypothetical protein L6164_006666 [Bauhinia variegata]